MPGKIKVKILAGRNLPVMDRSSDTTDAYVELKFGNITFKTDVCRKTLNPQWNSEWYRFEVDDSELQDEPLQIRLMDYDTYSANDAIGKVYINLNPLLLPGVPPTVKNIWTLEAAMNTNAGSQSGSVMTGWIPVYDTMHGIRGEVNIIVKVELFSDFNKFRQSSCGVQFFYSPNIPHGYHTQSIHGFVEELVVSDDPEYKWIDKIRTPRASNEARQTLFFKLSGEVQRKIGLKALDLGGNAVIGYLQNFDLEGESGIVARGIGTAVTLVKLQDTLSVPSDNIEEAFFSQHKAQKEHAGLDENMPFYPVTSSYIPDPVFAGTRATRIKDNLPPSSRASRSPRRIVKKFECPCRELLERSGANSQSAGLRKTAVSYPILTESVVQDASIRMMLALEDERGEGNKNILGVRKSLKRLFSSADPDGNPRLSRSARSSTASVQYLKEMTAKDAKATKGVAALLIKSLHSVPLENVKEDREIAALSDSPKDRETIDDNVRPEEGEEDEFKEEDRRAATPKVQTKNEHDSSFEENTPSSSGFTDESSIDSTGYNILSDSKFSSDEESAMAIDRFTKKLRRSGTFPPLRTKPSRIRLLRTDSDTLPLRERSTSPRFIKCLSTNQISTSKLEFAASSRIEEDLGRAIATKLNKNTEARGGSQSEQSSDNSQDLSLPLATSTPVEIRPPFFAESQQLDSSIADAAKKLVVLVTDFEKSEQPDHPNEVATIEDSEVSSTSAYAIKDDELSYADDSDVSVSAYSLLQSASDTEGKEKVATPWQRGQRFPSMIEEVDEFSSRDSFKDKQRTERLEERDVLKLTLSTQSLPSLQRYRCSTAEPSAKGNTSSKFTPETMSKASSSIESLIQSSGNEIFDVAHKNRQRRMMDLIRIIDTKMMVQPSRDNNDGRLRKRRRDRVNRNFTPRHLRKNLHNEVLKRRLQSYSRGKVSRVSSFSKRFPLNESMPALTPDTSSYNSSLESIIVPDTLIQSHSCRTVESFRSRGNVITKRSTGDPNPREIAAKELTLDTQSSDSLKNTSNTIEMQQLKSNDTNNLTLPTSVDHAVHDSQYSRSISDTNEALDHEELTNNTNTANMTDNSCVSRPSPDHRQQDEASLSPSYPLPAVSPVVSKVCQLPATKAQPTVSLHRRSSDSDLSVTPKGNSFGANDRSMTGLLKTSTAVIRTMNQDAFEMLEYPFITMQQYPPGFILHIGGLVSSRSVKLLERISNLEEPESRDAWWKEVRMEVRSHARALACNVVIGYREETSICDDVCVLNAYGTAAVINLHSSSQDADNVFIGKGQSGSGANPAEAEREKAQQKSAPIKVEKSDTDTSVPTLAQPGGKTRLTSESRDHEAQFQSKCSLCHLPYNEASVPFRVNVSKCGICKRARVPDVMFTTIELPENLATTGRGCIIQATACKAKKDLRGELNAKEISDCLPFLEYELHSLLLNKLKVKGMNAIFGVKLQVSVGERLIIGMAVGTAVFLTALPTPSIPQIASGNSWHKEEQLAEIQKTLVETVKQNREFYRLKPVADVENGRVATSDTDESDDDLPDLDFSVGPRDTCVLEVDDIEDMDRISLLMDDRPPEDFHVVNTQTIPGLDDLEIVRNLQMFTQISRTKIPAGQFASMPSKYFARLLQSVYFKLRRMIPCALCDMQFKLALPEPDEIQFTVIGMALGLGDPVKMNKFKKKLMSHSASKDQVKRSDDSDMIFNLDVDHTEVSSDNASSINANTVTLINTPALKSRTRSPLRSKLHATHRHKHDHQNCCELSGQPSSRTQLMPEVPLKGRYGVDITPLSYLPGGRIERYLGNFNFFFIRESTSIRENGGLSGFTHSFVMEVLAIVRAHITALGGNAMVAFFMTKCVLLHSPHKNQGQCLINVGGDVVSVSYFADEKHCGASNC